MQKMVEKILSTYGTAVTLCHEGEDHEIRAFFQPVRSKSWQYLEGTYAPLGEIPRGQFVYMGPVTPEATAGDTVLVGGKAYLLRRSELVRCADEAVYCWGMCVEKGGEDTWGKQS